VLSLRKYATSPNKCITLRNHLPYSAYSAAMSYLLIAAYTASQSLHARRRKRIFETFSMVVDCCELGSLTPNAQGWESIVKVRLLHARVRSMIQRKANWSNTHSSVSINQQDLAATQLAFSVVVISGLQRMGIRVAAQECEDYIHLW
jgi:ER-bound oxygenase mpaB/B'/Rubber oxygenase, catalytic domain